jgi:hypothetical protein
MAHPAVSRPVALSEANHQVIQKATATITTTGTGSPGLTARLHQLHHLGGWSPPRNRSLVRAGPNRTAHRTKSLTLYRSLGGGNPKPNTSISLSCSSKPQNTSSRSPHLLIFYSTNHTPTIMGKFLLWSLTYLHRNLSISLVINNLYLDFPWTIFLNEHDYFCYFEEILYRLCRGLFIAYLCWIKSSVIWSFFYF